LRAMPGTGKTRPPKSACRRIASLRPVASARPICCPPTHRTRCTSGDGCVGLSAPARFSQRGARREVNRASPAAHSRPAARQPDGRAAMSRSTASTHDLPDPSCGRDRTRFGARHVPSSESQPPPPPPHRFRARSVARLPGRVADGEISTAGGSTLSPCSLRSTFSEELRLRLRRCAACNCSLHTVPTTSRRRRRGTAQPPGHRKHSARRRARSLVLLRAAQGAPRP